MMAKAHILVVDDDRNLLELLVMRLEAADYQVMSAMSGRDAVAAIKSSELDLAVIDLQLADTDGLSLMEELRALNPGMPAIILTAHGSIENAVEAMRRGAFNYLTKPFDATNLLAQVEAALENRRLMSEVKRLRALLGEQLSISGIVSKSKKMDEVLEQVSMVAGIDATVLVQGESGTGKELIARVIHRMSSRGEGAFVAVNCAAIPHSLLERELFGHEKGAFTGAHKSSSGFFTQAHEGTLFLDEIGDMPLAVQAKLLRVLQEKQFYPVGSEKPLKVDVRIVAATNKNLEKEVQCGNFREDLYYRIHVIPIMLPPLRERKEDIPLLAAHLLQKVCKRAGKEIRSLAPDALRKLMMHDWPGNVRELENTIEYAVAMSRDKVIGADLVLQWKDEAASAPMTLKEAKDAFEMGYLMEVLRLASGNITKAAVLAGKYRPDLYNLLKKYNLKPEDFKR